MALETAAAAGRNCCKRAAEPGWRSALQSLVTPARVWARSPQGGGSALALALGHDIKGKRSAPLGLAGIVLASVDSWISDAIYVLVAPMRLIPDRRIERAVQQ